MDVSDGCEQRADPRAGGVTLLLGLVSGANHVCLMSARQAPVLVDARDQLGVLAARPTRMDSRR